MSPLTYANVSVVTPSSKLVALAVPFAVAIVPIWCADSKYTFGVEPVVSVE